MQPWRKLFSYWTITHVFLCVCLTHTDTLGCLVVCAVQTRCSRCATARICSCWDLFLPVTILAHTRQVTLFSLFLFHKLYQSVGRCLSSKLCYCSNKPRLTCVLTSQHVILHVGWGRELKTYQFKSEHNECYWISQFVVGILNSQYEGFHQWVPRRDIEKLCSSLVSLLPTAAHVVLK